MTIKQLINGKVAALSTTHSFVNCEESYANMITDETLTPVVLLAMPTIVKPRIDVGGRYVEVYDCLLFVLRKSQLDDNDTVQESTFETAKSTIRELMLRLEDDSTNVNGLQLGQINQVFHVQDCERSGASINFSLEIRNSQSVCV
jgi:hypothetical protein